MINVSLDRKNFVNLNNSGKNDSHLPVKLLKDEPDKIHLSFKKKLSAEQMETIKKIKELAASDDPDERSNAITEACNKLTSPEESEELDKIILNGGTDIDFHVVGTALWYAKKIRNDGLRADLIERGLNHNFQSVYLRAAKQISLIKNKERASYLVEKYLFNDIRRKDHHFAEILIRSAYEIEDYVLLKKIYNHPEAEIGMSAGALHNRFIDPSESSILRETLTPEDLAHLQKVAENFEKKLNRACKCRS